jgi:ubiquitin C-terminal hydrolase
MTGITLLDLNLALICRLSFPLTFDLRPYLHSEPSKTNYNSNESSSSIDGKSLPQASPSSKNIYDLVSILVHSGGANGGHYYSFLRNEEEKWFKFNDSSGIFVLLKLEFVVLKFSD